MHEGTGGVRGESGDQEELPVLQIPEVPRRRHEAQLDPLRSAVHLHTTEDINVNVSQ